MRVLTSIAAAAFAAAASDLGRRRSYAPPTRKQVKERIEDAAIIRETKLVKRARMFRRQEEGKILEAVRLRGVAALEAGEDDSLIQAEWRTLLHCWENDIPFPEIVR